MCLQRSRNGSGSGLQWGTSVSLRGLVALILLLASAPASSHADPIRPSGVGERPRSSTYSSGGGGIGPRSDLRYLAQSSCSTQQQIDVFRSAVACAPRPTVVELEVEESLDGSAALQVIPGHVLVERCAGSCEAPGHSCLPTRVENVTVQVMAIQTTYKTGLWSTMCAEMTVEKHLECGCACAVQPSDCDAALHEYDRQTCGCRCRDGAARARCRAAGKFWNEETCSCNCHEHTWTPCSTGYMFDYHDTCACVQVTADAGQSGLTVLVAVLSVLCLAVGALVFHLRRRSVDMDARRRTFVQILSNANAGGEAERQSTADTVR